MNPREYKEYLVDLSDHKEALIQTLERRVKCKDTKTLDAIDYRKSALSDSDLDAVSSFLSTGYFRSLDDERRLSAFCIVSEAEYLKEKTGKQKRCEVYSEDQAVFKQCPFLLEGAREDLVKADLLEINPDSTVFQAGSKWGYLDEAITPEVITWLGKTDADRTFIRINPHKVYDVRPPEQFLEFLVVPPDPSWWKNLTVYNRTVKRSSFALLEDPSDEDGYKDYKLKGVRSLQVLTSRDNDGNLSMMIEELSIKNWDLGPYYLEGRMIHLDSDAKIGEDFSKAKLNHLDLAINYYFDEDAVKRFGQDLALVGRIQNATARTHIIRLETVSFSELFPAAYSFFRSKRLVDEWKASEFS